MSIWKSLFKLSTPQAAERNPDSDRLMNECIGCGKHYSRRHPCCPNCNCVSFIVRRRASFPEAEMVEPVEPVAAQPAPALSKFLECDVLPREDDAFTKLCFDFQYNHKADTRTFREFPVLRTIDELQEAGNHSAALEKAEEGLKAHPDCYLFYGRVGRILSAMGNKVEARRLHLRELESSNCKYYACDSLGQLEFDSKRFAHAAIWWTRSCLFQLESRDLYFPKPFLALAYIAEGLGERGLDQWLMKKAGETGYGSVALSPEGAKRQYDAAAVVQRAGYVSQVCSALRELRRRGESILRTSSLTFKDELFDILNERWKHLVTVGRATIPKLPPAEHGEYRRQYVKIGEVKSKDGTVYGLSVECESWDRLPDGRPSVKITLKIDGGRLRRSGPGGCDEVLAKMMSSQKRQFDPVIRVKEGGGILKSKASFAGVKLIRR